MNFTSLHKKISTYLPSVALRINFTLFTLLTTLMYAPASQGGAFIIEPGVGYKQETLKLTDKTNNDLTKYGLNAPLAILKLQMYSSTGVSLGLAAEYSSGKAEIDPVIIEKPEFTHFIGAFQLGVSAMDTMKIYLGYAPVNDLELKTNTSFTGFKLKGHSYQAGLVFFPFHKFALGAQYSLNIYREVTGADFTNGKDTETYFEKMDSQDLSFTLSYLF